MKQRYVKAETELGDLCLRAFLGGRYSLSVEGFKIKHHSGLVGDLHQTNMPDASKNVITLT